MLKLILSFFTLLGLLGGVWHALGFFILKERIVESFRYEVIHSLDDKFVLVKSYSVTQGGALASNCQDSIFVFSSAIPVDEGASNSAFKVYSGSCDGFSDGSRSPRVRWIGARGVEVEFAINGARLVSHDVALRVMDFTGEVHVKFIVSE